MIYSNDGPAPPPSVNKSPNNLPPQRGPGGDPPSYGSSQGHPQDQPYAQTYTGYAVVIPRQTAGQRFIRAFLVATFIWILFSLFVQSTVTALHWRHRHGGLMLDGWEYTIPGDVSLEQCVRGGEWSPSSLNKNSLTAMIESSADTMFPFQSETSFDLPISSETLFFLSRGHYLSGVVNVVTSIEQPQDSATVQVVLKYRREEARDLVKACLISRKDGENGVGIFAPVWSPRRYPHGQDYHLKYEMTIILPEFTGDSAPLVIKKLSTDVPNSAHHIGDLNRKVFFDSISLSGSNMPIVAKSLATTTGNILTSNGPISGIFDSKDTLTVKTSNAFVSGTFNSGNDLHVKTSSGAIRGTFNSSTVLTLETSNAAILVDVGLESKTKGSKPSLRAHTSNGALNADISLTSESGSGGSFDVSTSTSNGPLSVTFPASPMDSKLDLKASTSNNPATVSLNPAYEGTFDLKTSSWFNASIHRSDPEVEDPTGKERKRQVKSRTAGKGTLIGEVNWDAEHKGAGVVSVRTSNSHIVLKI